MVDMAVLFGADKDVAKKELGESLQFEMDLANVSPATQNGNLVYFKFLKTVFV